MADGVEYKLTGVDELLGKLESITDDMKRKGGRAALRKAANVIANRAKANARRLDDPETGRSIADNIAVRWNGREFKRTGNLGFRIGVLHGAVLKRHPDKAKNAPTPHWRLLEFGTENMRAQPIMRPAAENGAEEAMNTFVEEYGKSIDRAIARAAKKGGRG
ncbi:TPA: HK97-gp10 family putative phage morphogenesis protein [Klebsiella oxytoca]|uniref:HK97-gp10 family putative phage morphogenesis protein n=1 Tax=Klebsiella oxytoca TaxID=571 RepID=UPI0019598A3A|nr:HK97-gp10 family putative phage morphogenesis protein [Klebsiella oxytoca]ELT9705701.1 HK97 gp10 family phage protein [Klebsiella michiganensis]ELD4487013.1 HK97 gp10 family phage protein [Klebsiella oxytoca]MCW9666249.1 HK97 gp10 family phage protein [Klebsiella oxytoca]QRT52558.1 HK97 gp10 family phage protein [Klebsiella oxytoca]HBM9172482.1 HK97 gp10 family phage protein [Klebsiella oxytoca]